MFHFLSRLLPQPSRDSSLVENKGVQLEIRVHAADEISAENLESIHVEFENENQKYLQQKETLSESNDIHDRQEFIACDQKQNPLGFIVVSIRNALVNGCKEKPVLYLDRIFVSSNCRNQGVGTALTLHAEDYGSENHCSEFAADMILNDRNSLRGYQKIGFFESERVVYMRKTLSNAKMHLAEDG